MKTNTFNRPLRASGAALTAALLLLAAANLRAEVPNGVVVGSLCGGGSSPFYGYVEGNPVTGTDAQFHTPIGLALDSTGEYLFVADRDNNAIRVVEGLPTSIPSVHDFSTYTFAPVPGLTSGAISKPVGVALDADDNVYVLNRGNGNNGTVVLLDPYGETTNLLASGLINANAIALDSTANAYVTAGNVLFKITPLGVKTTVTTVPGASLQGVVVMDSGMIAVCDSAQNGIWLINPANGVTNVLTGFKGAGDNTNIWQNLQNPPVSKAIAMFNQPMGLAKAGDGMLIVADYGNNRVKVVNSAGTVTNLYGVSSTLWCDNCTPGGCPGTYPGYYDGPVVVPDACGDVSARLPNGVLLAPGGTVYVTEDYYHLIRTVTANLPPPAPAPPANFTALANCGEVALTWSASPGATNYNVKRSLISGGPYTNNTIASTASTSYNDTNVLSGTTYYYVVSALGVGGEGANSAEVSATLPLPPAPAITTVLTNYGQVALTWSTISCPGVTYNVERSTTNGGPYATLANISATSYTDTNVLDGTTYYYVVSALADGGQSANSAPVSATVPNPPPPAILTVVSNCAQVTLTWSAVVCPSITYNVKQSTSPNGPWTTLANTASTSYTDTSVGNANGQTYYYVVSTLSDGGESANSAQVAVWVPHCQVPSPQIGYVDFPADTTPQPNLSVFTPGSSFVANNNVNIILVESNSCDIYYTSGPTGGSIPDPTTNSSGISITVGYHDGMSESEAMAYAFGGQILPDLTIKAIGWKPDGSPPSAIVSARFQFITANPTITGNNAAQFNVSDITTNAQMWYTTDGSTPSPTNGVGPISSGATLSLQFPAGQSNLTFSVMASNANYQASAVVTAVFSSSNFVPNSISFGFASGEASSDFVGSPGQTFCAPVTLNPLSDTVIYSMQFNLTVNPGGTNPGPAVTPGAYGFKSFLMKPVPGSSPVVWESIPPAMFLSTNATPAPTPPNQFWYNGGWFEPLTFTNASLNLLGVGWLETAGATNLYDTLSQDLIAFSAPHNTFFTPAMGKVVLGGYTFQIPPNAKSGQTYQIQIGAPSATSDGVGAPGSEVYIATPTNGSLAAGAINSIKIVTAGQRKYIAGDCAPFGWFNAGDFGDTNLDNSDVEQVFESAIYGVWYPPAGTDFFDSMDSCGGTYVDLGHGYLEFNSYISGPNALNPLFNGNDTSINQIAFGDGVLDVCDVYVTFRRSLDPSLNWFQRFWTNGVRGAQVFANPLAAVKSQTAQSSGVISQLATPTNSPSVNFAATDFIAAAGQTLQVPITAQTFGSYPLRVLMLGLTVEPLDGSPALTSSVQFTPNAALGAPALSASTGNGNYAAAWLNSTNAGLTGSATLGTLTVTIPTNATSSAAYDVHFDHASASPNGLASFPKQTLTGLITLSSRNNSSYNDGIPDSWRLRWFGTIYNALSVSNADACGDGIINWDKYIAGTDPTDPTAYPRLTSTVPPPAGSTVALHWPTVSGRQYVIQRATTLFPESWTAIATNTGTGTTMQFDDQNSGRTAFYRVQILP